MKFRNRLQRGSGDGFDADLLSFGVGAGGAVEAHMIDEGEGAMSEFGGASNEGLGRGGATEEGEVGFGEEFHDLSVNPGKVPFLGGEEGELDEEGIVEFDIPLGFFPAVFPPRAGERKGAASFADGALMGAGEEGERGLVAPAFFGGDVDRDWGALAFEGEVADGVDFGDGRSLKIGSDG